MKAVTRGKKSFRLGGGEFEASANEARLVYEGTHVAVVTISATARLVHHARSLFLDAATQVEPQVLESLCAGPFRIFEEISRGERVLFDWSIVEQTVELRTLRTALRAWAAQWHLSDSWCLEWGLQTMNGWRLFPQLRSWFHQVVGGGELQSAQLSLSLGSWLPTAQTREDFETNATSAFQQALKHYCDAVEAAATKAKLKRAPTKRSVEHFFWLARYQLAGEKPADIWRFHPTRSSGSRRAIEKAIKDLARLIGLTLR